MNFFKIGDEVKYVAKNAAIFMTTDKLYTVLNTSEDFNPDNNKVLVRNDDGASVWKLSNNFELLLKERPLAKALNLVDDKERIKHQMGVADKILKALDVINPTCIVAGGAPRDWYMGKPANDLDVYIHYSIAQPVHVLDTLQRELKGEWKQLGGDNLDFEQEYARLENMLSVYQGKVDGEIIQVIVMKTPTYSLVEKFPVSSSKIWYKPTSGIRPHTEFTVEFITNKVQVVADEYYKKTGTCKYLKKMLERFPKEEYTYIKKSDYDTFKRVDRAMKNRHIQRGVNNIPKPVRVEIKEINKPKWARGQEVMREILEGKDLFQARVINWDHMPVREVNKGVADKLNALKNKKAIDDFNEFGF